MQYRLILNKFQLHTCIVKNLAEFYDTRSLAEFYDTRSLAELNSMTLEV